MALSYFMAANFARFIACLKISQISRGSIPIDDGIHNLEGFDGFTIALHPVTRKPVGHDGNRNRGHVSPSPRKAIPGYGQLQESSQNLDTAA